MSAITTTTRSNGFCASCECLTSYQAECWYCGGTDLDYTYTKRFPLNSCTGVRLADILGDACS